jgi:hypothetical protein
MTAVVQPDLGPPAHKYKDNPADDPVSLSFFLFNSSMSLAFFVSIISPLLCYQGFPAPVLLPMLEGRKRKRNILEYEKHP